MRSEPLNKARRLPVFGARAAQQGFTIIEMVVAIVVIGVGVAGLLSAFSMSVRNSADPMQVKQSQVVADEIMEEILLKPYSSTTTSSSVGCARNQYYDVAAYNGYTTTGKICDVDGVAIAALNGYSLKVDVVAATLNGVAAARKITVTVTKGADNYILVGWRTDYAS
ncbi:prepilin-type N-terminal cleavage/methylation domain-containing protein [Aquabacterium sp.]|jgi:MSHA pilin protein MshD|uniref:prepilin-type N-terminal cleavage/methylation domain-containing protein n=1 Tax=Aquabacterium sp. TaxID=1872578 RepID=UPI0024887225|nr:prepilin-type N-terminal cleavage/methylation domain-containing protein [Aquabacterium sp.]MDI1348583.1 prepilin-type N-terminal cleavage/methylation domain-containing protein [Aquabacterium sp.]